MTGVETEDDLNTAGYNFQIFPIQFTFSHSMILRCITFVALSRYRICSVTDT